MSTTAPEATATGTEAQATTAPAEQAPAQTTQEAPKEQPKDDWKEKARLWEQRSKENAAAAAELAKIKKANQTEAERIAEEVATAKREAEEARSESLRWKAAATHHVSEDNFDLLGTGSAEEIGARAERVGKLEAAAAELKTLKAELAKQAGESQQTATGKQPVPQLKPGSASEPDTSYPTDWFPQMRPVETTNQ